MNEGAPSLSAAPADCSAMVEPLFHSVPVDSAVCSALVESAVHSVSFAESVFHSVDGDAVSVSSEKPLPQDGLCSILRLLYQLCRSTAFGSLTVPIRNLAILNLYLLRRLNRIWMILLLCFFIELRSYGFKLNCVVSRSPSLVGCLVPLYLHISNQLPLAPKNDCTTSHLLTLIFSGLWVVYPLRGLKTSRSVSLLR